MTEEILLKLLEMVAKKVNDSLSDHPTDVVDAVSVFEKTKKDIEALQDDPGECIGPFSEEIPEDHHGISWRWKIFCCKNHAHIIHLKFGYITVGLELAEKILVLGLP